MCQSIKMRVTHCKLKKSIQKKLLEFFILKVIAKAAEDLLRIQANSAILFYRKIREVISYHLALEADEVFDGQIELDERFFDDHRKGRSRCSRKSCCIRFIKTTRKSIYGSGRKYQEALMPVILRKIKPDSWVYTDTYRSYDALDVSKFHHERINHSELFAVKQNHINGIENFWSQAKRILRKYNGIDRKNFPLFLKECEFRFNFGSPKEQLKTW